MKLNQNIKEIENNINNQYEEKDMDLVDYVAGEVLWHHNNIGEIKNNKELEDIIEEFLFNIIDREDKEIINKIKNKLTI